MAMEITVDTDQFSHKRQLTLNVKGVADVSYSETNDLKVSLLRITWEYHPGRDVEGYRKMEVFGNLKSKKTGNTSSRVAWMGLFLDTPEWVKDVERKYRPRWNQVIPRVSQGA